jgi:Ankyrin repeats (3 copies)
MSSFMRMCQTMLHFLRHIVVRPLQMSGRRLTASLGFATLTVCVLGACTREPSNVFAAVQANDSTYVARWLEAGGNPNLLSSENESLLYVATGPKGGYKVLALLLNGCADPEIGAYGYTPLMNAASWVSLPAVEMLLAHGADPRRLNERGEIAIDVVGQSGGKEQAVIAKLKQSVQNAPNRSLVRSRCISPR